MTEENHDEMENSIKILHELVEIWQTDGKSNGYLYTDDPKYSEKFREIKEETTKLTANLEKIIIKRCDDEKMVDIKEMHSLLKGFSTMIGEVEVEESAINYVTQIEKIYQKYSKK